MIRFYWNVQVDNLPLMLKLSMARRLRMKLKGKLCGSAAPSSTQAAMWSLLEMWWRMMDDTLCTVLRATWAALEGPCDPWISQAYSMAFTFGQEVWHLRL